MSIILSTAPSPTAWAPSKRPLPASAMSFSAGEIDPSFVVTHSRPLEDGPELYKTFREKEDGCIKVVLKP